MGADTLPDLHGEAPKQSWANNFDGSGAGSDIANTVKSFQDGDWLGVGMNAAASAFDALGAVDDPLGALLSAGVGWLMEHVSFLREPLDKLAGDPGAIQAQANTWTNIGTELNKIKENYEAQVRGDIPQWDGDAAKAYRELAEELGGDIGSLGQAAGGVASGITLAGVLVGTERGIIRDLISTFIGKMIERALLALASSWCTFGASVAAFITDAVAEGGILAGRCASRIATVLDKLGQLLGKLEKLGGAVGKIAAKLSRLAKVKGVRLGQAAKTLGRDAGRLKSGSTSFRDGMHALGDKAKEIGKDAVKEQFTFHDVERFGDRNFMPPAGGVELGRQGHEAVEKNKEGHEQAEERVEGPKTGASAE
jgi:uncharacterized protein YukE